MQDNLLCDKISVRNFSHRRFYLMTKKEKRERKKHDQGIVDFMITFVCGQSMLISFITDSTVEVLKKFFSVSIFFI